MWWCRQKKEHCSRSVLVPALPLISFVTLGKSLSLLCLDFLICKTDTLHPYIRGWQRESNVKTLQRILYYKVHVRLLLPSSLTLSSINLLDLQQMKLTMKRHMWAKEKAGKTEEGTLLQGTRDLRPAFGRWRLHKMTTEKTESWPEQRPVDQNTTHFPGKNRAEWLFVNGKNNYTNAEFPEAWNKSLNKGVSFSSVKWRIWTRSVVSKL